MQQKVKRETSRRRAAAAGVPILALLLFAGAVGCAQPDPTTGPALEKIEAKLDAIEVKLDAPAPSPIPPDGSESIFRPGTPEQTLSLLRESARALACTHPLGCTCFLDGIQTGCGFVFGCIEAGFCECVSGCENIG